MWVSVIKSRLQDNTTVTTALSLLFTRVRFPTKAWVQEHGQAV